MSKWGHYIVDVTFVTNYKGEWPEKRPVSSFYRGCIEYLDDCRIAPKHNDLFGYAFLRTPEDFRDSEIKIDGELPLDTAKNFKALAKYGFMGLSLKDHKYYMSSWNAIYQIDFFTCKLDRIITNRMMCDSHTVYADNDRLYYILTGKDTIVSCDYDGNLIDHFTIDKSLRLHRDKKLIDTDWRFINKQKRGACGWWHFNYIQKIDNELWITSRNACSFIVVDLDDYSVRVETIAFGNVNLLHDGIKLGDYFYFSSVNGSIFKVGRKDEDEYFNNALDVVDLYSLSMSISYSIDAEKAAPILNRLEEEGVKSPYVEPTWCRGCFAIDNLIFSTIDGRYGQKNFKVVVYNEVENNLTEICRIEFPEKEIKNDMIEGRTGFAVNVVKAIPPDKK